jgi:hypothetical protein
MVSVPTHLRSDTGFLNIAELTIWPRHSKVRGVATLTERRRIAIGRAAAYTTAAMQSISRSNWPGQVGTVTKIRAGGSPSK